METQRQLEPEPEPQLMPLPRGELLMDMRAAFALREQARMDRAIRRDRINGWIAGAVLLFGVVGGMAAFFAGGGPSFKGSANTENVRRPR